jgi:hypothetical protein
MPPLGHGLRFSDPPSLKDWQKKRALKGSPFQICVILGDGLNPAADWGYRDDLKTFAECGAFDHFRQMIMEFSTAARSSTPPSAA